MAAMMMLALAMSAAGSGDAADFALATPPAEALGRITPAPDPTRRQELQFVDRNGWIVLRLPENATVTHRTDLRDAVEWRSGGVRHSCSIVPMALGAGVQPPAFAAVQASIESLHAPEVEPAFAPAPMKVDERAILTLDGPPPAPRVAAWNLSVNGAPVSAIGLLGPAGAVQVICGRADGGEVLGAMRERIRIGAAFAHAGAR